MTLPNDSVSTAAALRARAQALLKGDDAGTWLDATQALRVLFDLAANSETAADALALLHELQVHQVELDLQAEELSQSRHDLEAMLAAQRQLYDAAASALVVIDAQGRLTDVNLTAVHDLGMDATARNGLLGQGLDVHLTAESARQLKAQLLAVQQRAVLPSFELHLKTQGVASHAVCASLRQHPVGAGHVLAWVDWPSV